MQVHNNKLFTNCDKIQSNIRSLTYKIQQSVKVKQKVNSLKKSTTESKLSKNAEERLLKSDKI